MELFRLLGTIAINNGEAIQALNDTSEKGNETQSKLSGAFGKIGSAAVKVGKVVATGVAAGAGAIATLSKFAIDGYADFEQLKGGVETLFGAGGKSIQEYAESVGKTVNEVRDEYNNLQKAQNTVLANANEAYKTAGLSANEYMETVTSVSASLIQSLNGDTVKAAEKADQAIRDMSDNANKMGSSMESIQNAYNGFAKQNYTMLDNLKLGYGGTKEEMARLLEDATKLSGIKYDISSYADVVDAIHVIQDEMGITGTTAKEASATISGSIASMKSAWSNLVAGLGNDNANLTVLIDNFINSFSTVLDNVIPRLELILGGIAEVIKKIIPKISQRLPGLLKSLLPPLIEGAVALINGLVSALPTLLQILIEQIPFIVTQIGKAIVETFPVLLETVKQLIGQLWDYISLELLNTGVSFEDAFGGIKSVFEAAFGFIQTVWNTIGKPIFDTIQYCLEVVFDKFSTYMPEIQAFFGRAVEGIKDTWEKHLKPAFEAIGGFLKNVLFPIFELIFQGYIVPVVTSAIQTLCDLWEHTLKPVFDGICDFIAGVFSLDIGRALQGILNIVTGIFNGILTAIQRPMNTAKEIVNGVIEFIKKKFDFKWEFPKLKLPHFRINGSFSLNPPSVPSFGIDWYKKAMDDPMIMNTPTAFGINRNGQIMAGGEAGSEVVSGTETLMNMIAAAVAEQNRELVDAIMRIFALLTQYLPEMSRMQLVMDSGVLVGELAPGMDDALGKLAIRNGRGI